MHRDDRCGRTCPVASVGRRAVRAGRVRVAGQQDVGGHEAAGQEIGAVQVSARSFTWQLAQCVSKAIGSNRSDPMSADGRPGSGRRPSWHLAEMFLVREVEAGRRAGRGANGGKLGMLP